MTRLRHYRQGLGMSTTKLAAKVHSTSGYISQLETGTRTPSPWFAKLIADYFGVKVESLFPDGVSEATRRSKFKAPDNLYEPPPSAVAMRLDVCPKCGASGFFEHCYACGKPLVVEEVVAP
jgi:transcriptional regulator with XRE-family HTH domain